MRSRQRTTDWATHTFREHNTKKLVYVDSGMEAMTKANAVEALSPWPSRDHTMVYFLQKCGPVPVPWMLKWVDAGCLLTIYINGWKSAPAKSVQFVRTIEIEVVSLLPTVHFSAACVARGLTGIEPTTPVSFLRVVEARVCDATEAKVSVALRVRSYSCPRQQRRKNGKFGRKH